MYKAVSMGSLLSFRIARLESIGFAWRVGQDWTDFFARLKDYKDHHGTCEFPKEHDARLAAWIDSQRVSYRYRELSKVKCIFFMASWHALISSSLFFISLFDRNA